MDDENSITISDDANNETNIKTAENNSFDSHILEYDMIKLF